MIRVVPLFILSFILFGCAPKIEYTKSQAYAFVIKNKEIAIADTGFIKYSLEQINLQIYKATQPVFELNLKEKACINNICFEKEEFNRRFFSYGHYPGLMEDILYKRPIYDKKGFKKNKDGFEQLINSKNFDLIYKVKEDSVYFKDKKNGVLFKLKNLQ